MKKNYTFILLLLVVSLLPTVITFEHSAGGFFDGAYLQAFGGGDGGGSNGGGGNGDGGGFSGGFSGGDGGGDGGCCGGGSDSDPTPAPPATGGGFSGGDGGGDGGCCGGGSDSDPDTTGGSNDPTPPPPIVGCTDPNALNPTPGATVDDGSCTYPAPAPVCDSFTVVQDSIVLGDQIDISWQTSNTVAGVNVITFSDGINTYNEQNFTGPTSAGTYTYTLFIDGVATGCTDTLVVTDPTPTPTPVCTTFSIAENSVNTQDPLTFTWGTDNVVSGVNSVSINNGIGTVSSAATNQSFTAPATAGTYTYTLAIDGTDTNCTDTVTVTDPTPNPAPSCDSFAITEDSVNVSSPLTLNWNTTDVSVVTIANGLETVTQPVDGTDVLFTAPATAGTYTYTLAIDGTDTNCTDTVTVTDPTPNPTLTCSDISITADDQSVPAGTDTVLNWVSTGNVSSVTLDGAAVDLTSSQSVTVNNETTYTFEISGFGMSVPCDITIDTDPIGGGGGGSSSPRCELEVSDTTISAGEEVELTWETSRAREVILTDDQDNVLVTTTDRLSRDKEELFDGSITVTPDRDTTYTLLVERGRRDRECRVSVDVTGDTSVVREVRDQAPLVAGISLAQLPHTGFEAGPTLFTLFYLALVAWAGYIAYVMIAPTPARQTAIVSRNVASAAEVRHMQTAEKIRPDVFSNLQQPVVKKPEATLSALTAPAPTNLPVVPNTQVATPTAPAAATLTSATPVDVAAIEGVAHNNQVLLSSEACQTFLAVTPASEQLTKMKEIADAAKAHYPLEDGWVVINNDRMSTLLVA